jgi:hypothetical protein
MAKRPKSISKYDKVTYFKWFNYILFEYFANKMNTQHGEIGPPYGEFRPPYGYSGPPYILSVLLLIIIGHKWFSEQI